MYDTRPGPLDSRSRTIPELKYSLDLYKKSLPDSRGSLEGPDGVEIAAAGGMSIKANGPKNLFGALGDVYHILGRFEVKKAAPLATTAVDADAAETL